MSYVDGYVLAVPKKHLKAYRKMAALGRKAWMKHGAVDYKECAGDDLAAKWGTPFTGVMKLKPGETAIFAYIVFKSRAHRDRVNAKVMKEMAAMGGGGMNFYGSLPDRYKVAVNSNHPMIARMLEADSEEGQTRLARQAFDLALLSQGMLNGPELTEFVQRSVGMI